MKSKMVIKRSVGGLGLMAASAFFWGCVEAQNPTVTSKMIGGGGVIDSSGGNIAGSSEVEIQRAIDQLNDRLAKAFYRMGVFTSQTKVVDFRDESAEVGFENFTADEMRAFARAHRTLFSEDGSTESIVEYIREKRFSIELQRVGPCSSKDGHRDASADERNQTICVSLERMSRITPAALPLELTALVMHEVAHLFGLGEEEASMVQKFALWMQLRGGLLMSNADKYAVVALVAEFEAARNILKKDLNRALSSTASGVFNSDSLEVAAALGSMESASRQMIRMAMRRTLPPQLHDDALSMNLASGVYAVYLSDPAGRPAMSSLIESVRPGFDLALERTDQEVRQSLSFILGKTLENEFGNVPLTDLGPANLVPLYQDSEVALGVYQRLADGNGVWSNKE